MNDVGRGVGVCIYVKKVLKVNVINFFLPKRDDLWLSVQSNMYPAVVIECVWYMVFQKVSDSCSLLILRQG